MLLAILLNLFIHLSKCDFDILKSYKCYKYNGIQKGFVFGESTDSASPMAQSGGGQYNYLRCWRCDYDDKDQCVKNFDFTKHKHEACDGKCLKAFEKVEARTKVEIEKSQCEATTI